MKLMSLKWLKLTDFFLKLKYNCNFANLLNKTVLTNNLISLVVLDLLCKVKRHHDMVVLFKAISQMSRILAERNDSIFFFFKKKAILFWRWCLFSEYGKNVFELKVNLRVKMIFLEV